MKKLVIDALIFEPHKAYGYQEYLFNLLDYFYINRASIKYEKIIIACSKKSCNYFEKYSDIFEISPLNFSTKLGHLWVQNLLKYKFHLNKKDLVLFTYNYSSLIKQGQHLLVIHDLLYLRKNYLPNFMMRFQRRIFIPRSIQLSDKIIAISNFTKQDIIRNYPNNPNRIDVIYNYFNFEKFNVSFSEDMNIEFDYFLSICSSAYHKNTITVLRGFVIFAQSNRNTHLVLVGGIVHDNSELYSFYKIIPDFIKCRIHVYENVANSTLRYLYSHAMGFISATLFEGLGMPIVEAMYFNLPLILSNIEVCREVSLNMGRYFESMDYLKLSQYFAEVENQHKRTSTKNNALEMYSEKETSERYINLINLFYID